MSSNNETTPKVDYDTSFTYPSTKPNTARKQIIQFSGSDEELFEKIKELKKEGVVSICIRYIYNNKSHVKIEFDMPKNKSNSSTSLPTESTVVQLSKGGKRSTKKKTQKKRVRVCFSKKGKKTRCKYMKLSLPKRR